MVGHLLKNVTSLLKIQYFQARNNSTKCEIYGTYNADMAKVGVKQKTHCWRSLDPFPHINNFLIFFGIFRGIFGFFWGNLQ